MKINPWSIPGDLKHRSGATDQNCSLDINGHEAYHHDDDLEDVGPDHSFNSALMHGGDTGVHEIKHSVTA